MIPTLKTNRLKLRPLTFSDRDAMISAIMSDRDVMHWLPCSHAVSTPQGQREVAALSLEVWLTTYSFDGRRNISEIFQRRNLR